MMTASDSRNTPSLLSRIPHVVPLLTFIFLVFLIAGARYAIFEEYKKSITEKEVQNLGAIADLKVAQIVAWRDAHRQRAEYFLHGAMFPDEVGQWLREGAPANERKQRILKYLVGLQREQGYKSISLLDKEGILRGSTNGSHVKDIEEKKLAVEAMSSQRVLFSDLHRVGHEGHKIAIDCVAPLMATDEKTGAYIVGALLFEIDPDSFLYPMIQSWPTPSPSAETLLIQREGDDILFLNELRHKKGTALSLRLPLTNKQLPVVRAVLGLTKVTEVTEGIDYRGISVVAALRSVPDTPWFMVAKVDKDELFAPINQLRKWTAGLGISFVALGGGLFFVWFRGAQARYQQLKAQHDAALERELLLKHFEYLTKYANDMIIVANEMGQIIEANERAQQALGYSREELLQKHVVELHGPLNSSTVQDKLEVLKREGALRGEGVFQRKDGSTFPVEMSTRVIEVQDTRYLQGIIRDITERKAAEATLAQAKAMLQLVLDTIPVRVFWKDQESRYLGCNRLFAKDAGLRDSSQLVGKTDYDLCWAEQAQNYILNDRAVMQSMQAKMGFEMPKTTPDGKLMYLEASKVPLTDGEGNLIGVLGTYQDITQRKLAEERLRESYKELENLTTHLEAVREDEQKRIARELHDEMGGVLAALNMKVSLMAEQPPSEMADILAEVADLEKLVEAGIQALRRTVTELRPSLLDEVGIAFAIERYVQDFEENTKIVCDLHLPEEELTLDGNQSTAIFRIVQESLTNVAKHAEASRVSIALSEWETSLVLTVKDNGKGFGMNNQKAKSFGLLGIRERAAMVGGKAQITSKAGKGTTVRVSLPLIASRHQAGLAN